MRTMYEAPHIRRAMFAAGSTCDDCGCGIHRDEEAYEGRTRFTQNHALIEKTLCEDCFREYVMDELRAMSASELADRLGHERWTI